MSGPYPARDKGLCNACVNHDDAVTKGGHIKSTARVWILNLQWVEVRLCAACMRILGSALVDAAGNAYFLGRKPWRD